MNSVFFIRFTKNSESRIRRRPIPALTPAPVSIAAVAPFRAWRGSQYHVAGRPVGPPLIFQLGITKYIHVFCPTGQRRFAPLFKIAPGNFVEPSLPGSKPESLCKAYKTGQCPVLYALAEREGFEPSIRGYRIHTFQACAFSRSATSPYIL